MLCKEQKDLSQMMEVLLPPHQDAASVPFNPLKPRLRDSKGMPDVDQTKVIHRALISDRLLALINKGQAATKELVEVCKTIAGAVFEGKWLLHVSPLVRVAMEEMASTALALLCLMNVAKTAQDQKHLDKLLVAKAGSGIVVKEARC